ncbi:unnamed protein product [Oikopleura dioica]|uniref:PHD-type domain-containing protein n=1 Tax=Oikopleura dioica TaxID=34765 RepID=E4YV67_OIKDI|nr:unnamed protein product [Oikopleura dioica]
MGLAKPVRKEQAVRQKCVFCNEPGLLASEIPLDDRTREKLNDLCRKKENDEMAALELKRNKLYRRPRYNKPEFEINHGQWLVDQHATNGEDISCHYNCLISSSGLYVRPQDEGGLPPKQYKKFTIGGTGYLRSDIIEEVKRAKKLKCCICKRSGANIGCMEKCNKSFHYACAKRAGYTFVADNNMCPAFCWKHSTRRYRYNLEGCGGQPKYCLDVSFNFKGNGVELADVDEQNYVVVKNDTEIVRTATDYNYMKLVETFLARKATLKEDSLMSFEDQIQFLIRNEFNQDQAFFQCQCCLEFFDDLKDIVLSKCCKFANFHRDCLSKLAIQKGLCKIKCPLCFDNNVDMFVKSCIAQGVNIPNRESVIELEGNFDEQYAENKTKLCGLKPKDCKYPQRSGYDGTEEEVVLCDDCGHNGIHIACHPKLKAIYDKEEGIRKINPSHSEKYPWVCDVCAAVGSMEWTPSGWARHSVLYTIL